MFKKNKNHPHYDAALTAKIRKLRPWWFDKSASKPTKEELLKIAMKPIV